MNLAEFDMVFWYWWILAVLLLGIEILVPGFFFLWLSISGLLVGTVLLLIPSTSLELQLLLFALLSITSIFVWRKFGFQYRLETDQPLLNQRGAQYIGRTFPLFKAIENGRGKIMADGSIWIVEGEDCSLDAKVEVTSINGTVFEVKLATKESH